MSPFSFSPGDTILNSMIPDRFLKFITDEDNVLGTVLFLFFIPEMIMMYSLTYETYWIPLVSIILRLWIFPIINLPNGKYHRMGNLLLVAISTSIGYGILFFMGLGSVLFNGISCAILSIIVLLQFTEWIPNTNNRILSKMNDKNTLWKKCKDIEVENKKM